MVRLASKHLAVATIDGLGFRYGLVWNVWLCTGGRICCDGVKKKNKRGKLFAKKRIIYDDLSCLAYSGLLSFTLGLLINLSMQTHGMIRWGTCGELPCRNIVL